jgi:hypothetical protein
MKIPGLSRRGFLKSSAIAGGAATIGGLAETVFTDMPVAIAQTATAQASNDRITMNSPADGELLKSFLTAKLSWGYAATREETVGDGVPRVRWNYYGGVRLKVSANEDMRDPLTDVRLQGNVTSWCLAVLPNHKYYWQIIPSHGENADYPDRGFKASFTVGEPRIDETTDANVRYRNPRAAARFASMAPIPFAQYEPLSPWYEVKSYNCPPPPKFEEIKDKLPLPVFDGHPDALEAYWYCWRTLLDKWYWAPDAVDHQAVANMNGCGWWSGWGSSQVWDSAFMMYFARYGHQAYPFINQYDNAYARQHENGFICRESDANNQEVYGSHPALCPFLMGWAEWRYYQVSGDAQRLRRVLLPIVKNYEWWMTYMRRKDGLYWKQGLSKEERLNFQGDDSLDYAIGNNATRAAEALYIAKIAAAVGRSDLAAFFQDEHARISRIVNDGMWDSTHGIYNDRCDPEHPILKYNDPKLAGEFVTEIQPGVIDKPFETLMPLFGEIVPPQRLRQVIQELGNPRSFNRPNGIPKTSADSANYNSLNAAVWPPPQCMVQEGLKAYGETALLQEIAEKYFNAIVAAYMANKTIHEGGVLADRIEPYGNSDFVGWGGLGPVANLIEYILGFELNVPENTITWRISRTERHGIKNLRFGDFYVELLCEERKTGTDPCHVTVTSGGTFHLKVIGNAGSTEKNIETGTTVFHL